MPTKMALAMAPPFRPWKAGEAPEHGNSLISAFFKRSRKGRPKKSGTLAADKVKVNVVKRAGTRRRRNKTVLPNPPKHLQRQLLRQAKQHRRRILLESAPIGHFQRTKQSCRKPWMIGLKNKTHAMTAMVRRWH
jgi:hypothetical protein